VHAGRHFGVREVLRWTRRQTLVFFAIGAAPVLLHYAGLDVPDIPWPPLAVLGLAVAFVTGFKNNAAYGRLWEARQIWGGIVNSSRAWAVSVRDFIDAAAESRDVHRRLVYRHLAWVTALRYQLREPRAWEAQLLRSQVEYQERVFPVIERTTKLDDELAPLLSEQELAYVLSKKNRANVLLSLQSEDLAKCAKAGWLSEYKHLELVRLVTLLFDHQGRCERIKNFPYPRQFATLNLLFIWLFIVLLPLGLHAELVKLRPSLAWLTLPLTVIIAWVFHTMDRIGDVSESPFEAGANDIPITALARSIEIDLRDLADEKDLPPALQPVHNILM
jgi:putative membrane protein